MPAVRRLAAILAADVAGYSRLMGADEEGTHERLKAHLGELGNPKTNRAGFAGSPEELATARSVFAGLLCRPESISALDTVAEAAQHELLFSARRFLG